MGTAFIDVSLEYWFSMGLMDSASFCLRLGRAYSPREGSRASRGRWDVDFTHHMARPSRSRIRY
jgi:hypothetical protein